MWFQRDFEIVWVTGLGFFIVSCLAHLVNLGIGQDYIQFQDSRSEICYLTSFGLVSFLSSSATFSWSVSGCVTFVWFWRPEKFKWQIFTRRFMWSQIRHYNSNNSTSWPWGSSWRSAYSDIDNNVDIIPYGLIQRVLTGRSTRHLSHLFVRGARASSHEGNCRSNDGSGTLNKDFIASVITVSIYKSMSGTSKQILSATQPGKTFSGSGLIIIPSWTLT